MSNKKTIFQLKPSTVAVSLVLASMYVTPALAEDAEDAETMVVTGTRSSQLLEKVPANVEVITAQDIEMMGATSVVDILERTSGITSTGGGIGIRGLGSDYTVILVNGRKSGSMENSKDFQSYLTSSLDVASIERIEVLSGQAGSMYGSNAIGGVVNIITKQSMEPTSSFSLTHSTVETQGNYRHDFGQQGKFFGMVGGSYINYNSEESQDYSDGSSSYSADGKNYTVDGELGYVINDSNKVRFTGSYQYQNTLTPTISQELTDSDDDGAVDEITDSVSYRTARRSITDAAVILDGFVGDHSYTAGLSWNLVDLIADDEKFQTIILDVQNEWVVNDFNTVIMGAEFMQDYIDRPSVDVAEDTSNRYALYVQDEISLFNDTLLLLPSARLDSDSDFGEQLTYQFGASYQLLPGHYLKGNYGLGYKAPTLTELYSYETRSSGTVWGNPDLQPEESDSFDFRYEYHGKKLSGSIGYYNTHITNQYTTVYCDDLDSSSAYYSACEAVGEEINGDNQLRVNALEVKMQGVEAELAYKLTKNLNVKATYIYLDGEEMDEDGVWAAQATTSEEIYGLDLSYYKPENGVGINAWGKLNLGTSGRDSDELYDYYNFNMSVSKELPGDSKLILAGYNLIQSSEDTLNTDSLDDLEVRLSFQAKL